MFGHDLARSLAMHGMTVQVAEVERHHKVP
jgi:hypothetical protein